MLMASLSRSEERDADNVVMAASVGESDAEEDSLQAHVRPVHMKAFINFLHRAPVFF
jgi:hypothetical protein